MEKQKKNYKIFKIIQKIKTIALSRFKKTKDEDYVKERREICRTCPLNTKNQEKVNLKIKLIKFISDLYTFVTFNKKTDLGSCGHETCGCDIFYKSIEIDEKCPEKKWK